MPAIGIALLVPIRRSHPIVFRLVLYLSIQLFRACHL